LEADLVFTTPATILKGTTPMRKRFVDAITGYYRKWQEKSEGERLVLVIQYLTVLTMVLGLIRSLFQHIG
jgi:hypothetical protein